MGVYWSVCVCVAEQNYDGDYKECTKTQTTIPKNAQQ